jgi:4-aminobutyrate aminotransferase-like enzyme
VNAIKAQLENGPIHTYTFPNARRTELCAKLTEISGFEKAALFTTGSEAVEAAIKAAREYTGRNTVVSWVHSMHGKTLGSQNLMYGGPDVIRREWTNRPVNTWSRTGIAAVIIETYQGWGARWYPIRYVQDVAKWCERHDVLLIFDEVQAGFARTGQMFGYEWYCVKPDMVVCGKGLGGGMPVSALLGPADVLNGDLSSTHGGNAVCCAAALATLDVIENEGLVKRAQQLGRNVIEPRLAALGHNLPIHGRGCAWAVWLSEFPRLDDVAIGQADQIVDLAAERGLLLLKTGCGTIKIGPPLTIPESTLIEGLDILRDCIKEVLS